MQSYCVPKSLDLQSWAVTTFLEKLWNHQEFILLIPLSILFLQEMSLDEYDRTFYPERRMLSVIC